MVNSATSDLNNPTEIGRALNDVGGSLYKAECKSNRNIPKGDIVTTIGGKLSCKYVIHAVCCDWDSKDRDENVSTFKRCHGRS